MKSQITTTIVTMAVLFAAFSRGIEIGSDPDAAAGIALHPTLKLSALGSKNPDDPVLYASDRSAASYYRLRLDLDLWWSEFTTGKIAYEHSGRWTSRDDLSMGNQNTSTDTRPPFRLSPLYEELTEKDRFVAYHELDRALISFHPEWGEITIGRQAIGLGRGRIFSAVDLFSPFSPLDVDREWRRGVDAIRVEARSSPTTSVEAIIVGGENVDESAWILRGRGYVGDIDAELLGGVRGEDEFIGCVVSGAFYDAEIHAETAVFRIDEPHPDGQIWGNDRMVPKAVVGSSYTFGVGSGLTLLGEYHYSGFGAKEITDATVLFSQPEYQERLLRGDVQIYGRHAVGLQASYSVTMALSTSLSVLVSPKDGSGTLFPSLRWDLSQTTSLLLTAYLPWGEESENGVFQSEYGASPRSLFAQLGVYF